MRSFLDARAAYFARVQQGSKELVSQGLDFLTLFPRMLEGPLAESIPGRVQAEGIATLRVHDLRRWGLERAARGGGQGKKRAVVAVARRLAILLHRLWVSGETYRPLRSAAT